MVGADRCVHLNKSQCLSIAVAIINDIDTFCEERAEEFQKFLESEESHKKKGGGKNDKERQHFT